MFVLYVPASGIWILMMLVLESNAALFHGYIVDDANLQIRYYPTDVFIKNSDQFSCHVPNVDGEVYAISADGLLAVTSLSHSYTRKTALFNASFRQPFASLHFFSSVP